MTKKKKNIFKQRVSTIGIVKPTMWNDTKNRLSVYLIVKKLKPNALTFNKVLSFYILKLFYWTFNWYWHSIDVESEENVWTKQQQNALTRSPNHQRPNVNGALSHTHSSYFSLTRSSSTALSIHIHQRTLKHTAIDVNVYNIRILYILFRSLAHFLAPVLIKCQSTKMFSM